ncbi:MAG: diacylglycerol kinase family protein [Flammeovirgaceae bacterium]
MKQARSFRYAFRGLIYMGKDHNTLVHFPAAVIVIFFAWYFEVTRNEWLWLILAISIMWISETFNTAIEKLTDLVSPDFHPLAGKVKDISAAGVLLGLFFAAIIGFTVFFPYIQLLILNK